MASVFRSAANVAASKFSGAVALSMIAATYAVAPMPAAAIEGLPAHCAKVGNELAKLKCGTAYYKERRLDAEAQSADAKASSADAKARSADAEARAAAADARIKAADEKIAEAKKSDDEVASAEKCFDFLKQGIGANRFKREAVLESAGGKVTVENACPTAARYGYERRASAAVPDIR